MSSDPEAACIVRTGAPGSYRYDVIAGRENFPITYVNESDEEKYFSELNQPASENQELTTTLLKSNRRRSEIAASLTSPSLCLKIGETTPSLGEDVLGDGEVAGEFVAEGIIIDVALGILFPEAAAGVAAADLAEDIGTKELSTAGENATTRAAAERAASVEDHLPNTHSTAPQTEEPSSGRLSQAEQATKTETKHADSDNVDERPKKVVKKKPKETSAEKAARIKRSQNAIAAKKAEEAKAATATAAEQSKAAFATAKQSKDIAQAANKKTLQLIDEIQKKISEKLSSLAELSKKNEWAHAIDEDKTIGTPKFKDDPNAYAGKKGDFSGASAAHTKANQAFLNIIKQLSAHFDELEKMKQSLVDTGEVVSNFFTTARNSMSDVYNAESLDAINTADDLIQLFKNTSDGLSQIAQEYAELIKKQEAYLKQVDGEYEKAIKLKASWGKGVLNLAKTGKGNKLGNFGLGEATEKESLLLSQTKMWAEGSNNLDGSINNYRDTSWKKDLQKNQANFERIFYKDTDYEWKYNAHLDIVPD